MDKYVVVISIWGQHYKSLPMSLGQCEQAESQAKETHPGIQVTIEEVVG